MSKQGRIKRAVNKLEYRSVIASMIKKECYLDAMGISRWRSRNASSRQVVLCDDIAITARHPLVHSVLALLGYQVDSCHFQNKAMMNDQVVWDLRKMNRPHRPGILYSLPITQLMQGSEAKRQLWQQIWQRDNQCIN